MIDRVVNSLPPVVPAGASFAFGESPFRAKGVLYQGTQSYFESRVPGGMEKLVETIEEPELREFISQRFLSSVLYDVLPAPALIAREARAAEATVDDYLRARTEWQAHRDIHGVYRVLLRLVSPERVITRLPQLLIQLFDFPEAELDTTGERARRVTFRHIPKPLVSWLRVAFEVYTRTAMTAAGAKDLDIAFEPPTPEESRAGVPMREMLMTVSWR